MPEESRKEKVGCQVPPERTADELGDVCRENGKRVERRSGILAAGPRDRIQAAGQN